MLALTTGARSGEPAGLKAGDVDLRSGTLRIARTVYNGVVGTPKSKRNRRTIKLPRKALDTLTAHIGLDVPEGVARYQCAQEACVARETCVTVALW